MGNNASIPVDEASGFGNPPAPQPPLARVKKSSLPALPSQHDAPIAHTGWRRASEPIVLPRRKSFLRRNNRRRSDENKEHDVQSPPAERAVPMLKIDEGPQSHRSSRDSSDGLLIRVGERKFSRAEPVDTVDALEALERITRAASFSAPSNKASETGLGLMTRDEAKTSRPTVPFSFDVNYRLDSPGKTKTFTPSPALQPFPVMQQNDVSPHESPAGRFPLSPISHWSDSSACGLTPPQTFQSFRNSVNLPKTINRYSNLFLSSSTASTPSPQASSIDLAETRSPAKSKLGGLWKSQRKAKGTGKGRGKVVGEIVMVKAERVGSSRYSELRAAADSASDARSSSRSSSMPTSPEHGNQAPLPPARTSPGLDRASWIELEPDSTAARPRSRNARRHSSPDPQLAKLVAASPKLAFAGPLDNIFVPLDSATPLHPVNPTPVKTSTRLPRGHPAAYHQDRFNGRRSPPIAIRRPRFLESSRTSSYMSAHRASVYTNNSRHSVLSEVESTSSALQATVQQGFRTSRVGSIAIPLSEVVAVEPPSRPFPLPQSASNETQYGARRSSAASEGWNSSRRPSQASALSFPRSNSPECPRTVTGRKLSLTSTLFGDSPSSQESTPPPVPVAPSFDGYSLEMPPRQTAVRQSPPQPLDLDLPGARSTTPNSLPPLSATSAATVSTRSSSSDRRPSLQVPAARPYGRLSLEQPDFALSALSKPLPCRNVDETTTIDFGNFSLVPHRPPPPPPRHHQQLGNVSPTMATAAVVVSSSSPSRLQGGQVSSSFENQTRKPNFALYSWNRASADDAVRLPSSSAPLILGGGEGKRRETYPRVDATTTTTSGGQHNVFDTLVQRSIVEGRLVVEREQQQQHQRKRGLSREEVEMWLGDRT